MVRPANFGFNPETAADNAFQKNDAAMSTDQVRTKAIEEFDSFYKKLVGAGIEVLVAHDTPQPLKTDAIFPNNWFVTLEDGFLYTFPMYAANRRSERRTDIIETVLSRSAKSKLMSLESFEEDGKYLEGTGSMILDRTNRIIYACISERTNCDLLEKFAGIIGYDVLSFRAVDENEVPYYHTNVIMTLGEEICLLCSEAIGDENEKELVEASIVESGRMLLRISREQVAEFVGNMLEVRSQDGRRILVMSENAYQNLTGEQREIIQKIDSILYSPLTTIEKYGGGSARCMLAELFF
jgi:hypothetical protein